MSNPLEITQGRSEYNNPSNFLYIFESFDNVDQLLETYKLEREALFDKLKDTSKRRLWLRQAKR